MIAHLCSRAFPGLPASTGAGALTVRKASRCPHDELHSHPPTRPRPPCLLCFPSITLLASTRGLDADSCSFNTINAPRASAPAPSGLCSMSSSQRWVSTPSETHQISLKQIDQDKLPRPTANVVQVNLSRILGRICEVVNDCHDNSQ